METNLPLIYFAMKHSIFPDSIILLEWESPCPSVHNKSPPTHLELFINLEVWR